jgi:hypothetical protein
MDHRAILNAIGHYTEIARQLGVHPTSVCRWQTDGIPPVHWAGILRMARSRRVKGITLDLIESTSPVYGEARKDRSAQPVS